jgi:predicted porin
MKKKLMAVAVGAALAAPALSYAAVEISGRANVGIGTWSATGSTGGTGTDYKSRLRVWDSGSNITIKSSEDLGGGLKAEFYLETGINVNSGDANGAGGNGATAGGANSATGNWGSRQAWAGLSGNFGKVLFGKINTWYGSGDQDLTQAVYLDSSVQFGTGVLAAGPGVNRQTNALRYNSPMLGPVEVLVTYAPQYAANATTMQAGDRSNGNVLAFTVQGSQGPISGGIDQVTNTFGKVSTDSGQQKNTATKIRAGFKYQPGAQISLIIVNAKQDDINNAAGVSKKQNAWEINWEHQMGNIGLHAQYGVAGKVTTQAGEQADTGTKAMELGIRFIMSKTVYTYVNYVAYTNDPAANLDFNAGGMSSAGAGGIPTTSAGADPKSLAFGVSYRF